MISTTSTTTVSSSDVFENILPDDVSFTDLLKSPQSIFLVKDQQTKSGLASPYHYQNLWKVKEDFGLDSKNNANDEFMEMYQFSNTEDHRLTNMFAHKGDKEDGDKGGMGFQKIAGLEPPLVYSDNKERNNGNGQQRKPSDDIIIDDEDDEDVGQRTSDKRKLNKGLKLLSVIVKDIVVEKQSTTYKEVADIILKDTIKFENLNLNSKLEIAKEEQNIKRRVYDALNVLISAGVLIKEGKMVRKNFNNKKIILNLKRLDANTYASKIVN